MKIQFLNQPIGPPMKLSHPITEDEIRLQMAVQQAVDKLPHGKFNPQAKQVAAQAKARHHLMTVLQSIHSMRELSETLDPNLILPEPIYSMEPTAIARMLEVERDEMEYAVAEWQERLASAPPLEAAQIVMEWIQALAQTLVKIDQQEE